MKTVLILCALLLPCISPACPLGPGEAELTLSRVMRNFGRYLSPADRIVQRATMGGGQEIPNADLQRAIESLGVVLACNDVTMADRSGSLWPRKARELSGEAREQYLALFRTRLADFRAAVVDYRTELTRLLGQPVPGRDFLPAKALSSAVTEAANRAHETLN